MAKNTTFRAWDMRRKKLHTLSASLIRISNSRLGLDDPTNASTKHRTGSKGVHTSHERSPKLHEFKKTVADALRCAKGEVICLHCGRWNDGPQCGYRCYVAFRKFHFLPTKAVEIRGPGKLGYSVFLSPTTRISRGQFIGEYVGELRPHLASNDTEDRHNGGKGQERNYRFVLPTYPQATVLDASRAGNWTRFLNSSCKPNLSVWGDTIGGRHVVIFEAKRDINPGEELTYFYGRRWFDAAGLICACDAHIAEHVPQLVNHSDSGETGS